jgi:glyoxalase family protein
MTTHVSGIHHITAISSDPQQTYDFYAKILGLRLVKKTVNQDDVQTYHLFFGDVAGGPGMDLTFFTFQPAMQGLRGLGQVTLISLVVPQSSLTFWKHRFDEFDVQHEGIAERVGYERIIFYDQDLQRLELVGVPDELLKKSNFTPWEGNGVQAAHAICAFFSARLSVSSNALIEPVLTKVLGYTSGKEEQGTTIFKCGEGLRAKVIEVEESPEQEQGVTAAGTVHHIAFEVEDEAELLVFRKKVLEIGLYPTHVINRFYFQSVYFRTHAGILFELATSGPGFAADESGHSLGKKLALPPFLEDRRAEIEAGLEPIVTE